MVNVVTICVTAEGDTEEHVFFLYDNLRKTCSFPFTFTCISDVKIQSEEIKHIPLKRMYNNWNKLQLFSNDLFHGRVLFISLHCIVLKDLTFLLEKQTKDQFACLEDPDWPGKLNTSLCLWDTTVLNLKPITNLTYLKQFKRGYWFDRILLRKLNRMRIKCLYLTELLENGLYFEQQNFIEKKLNVLFFGRQRYHCIFDDLKESLYGC